MQKIKMIDVVVCVVYALLFFAFIIYLSSCAKVTVSIPLPDGRVVEGEYVRWFNQEFKEVKIIVPDMCTLYIAGQKSDTELIFNAGRASIGLTKPTN